MKKEKRTDIIQATTKLFALTGVHGFSMRKLANECDTAASVLYHYFPDKDELLKDMYLDVNKILGEKRKNLYTSDSAADRLKTLLKFQFLHAQEVVAVLKYYMAYRDTFSKNERGFLPEKAYLHAEEILEYGVETGEFEIEDILKTSKVLTHAINGYLLEYYPHTLDKKELDELIEDISSFFLKALESAHTLADGRKEVN